MKLTNEEKHVPMTREERLTVLNDARKLRSALSTVGMNAAADTIGQVQTAVWEVEAENTELRYELERLTAEIAGSPTRDRTDLR